MLAHRHSLLLTTLTLLGVALLAPFAAPAAAQADELSAAYEEVRQAIFGQIDDFAIESCDPPCPGKICCDNGVCVSTVLACGFYPIHIDSFRLHGSDGARAAGVATQGVLAAEHGREARLWFGQLDGEAWRQRGVEPGTYELVLEAGATSASAFVRVVDQGGRQVARLGGHFWVFSSATSSVEALDWNLDAFAFELLACHDGECVELQLPLASGG